MTLVVLGFDDADGRIRIGNRAPRRPELAGLQNEGISRVHNFLEGRQLIDFDGPGFAENIGKYGVAILELLFIDEKRLLVHSKIVVEHDKMFALKSADRGKREIRRAKNHTAPAITFKQEHLAMHGVARIEKSKSLL